MYLVVMEDWARRPDAPMKKLSIQQVQFQSGLLHVDTDGDAQLDVAEARSQFLRPGTAQVSVSRMSADSLLVLSDLRSAFTGIERDITLSTFSHGKFINVASTLAVAISDILAVQAVSQPAPTQPTSTSKGVIWNGVQSGGSTTSAAPSMKTLAKQSFDLVEQTLGLQRFDLGKQDAASFLLQGASARQLQKTGAEALTALAADVKLTVLIDAIAAAVRGWAVLPVAFNQAAVINALAAKLAAGQVLDEALTSNISDLLSVAGEDAGVLPDSMRADAFIAGLATVLEQVFARIDHDMNALVPLLGGSAALRAELRPLLANYEVFAEVLSGDIERAWDAFEDRLLLSQYTGDALAARFVTPGDALNHVISNVGRDVITLTAAADVLHVASGLFSSAGNLLDPGPVPDPDTAPLVDFDEVLGFTLGVDALRLGQVTLMEQSVIDRLQVDADGVVRNIVPDGSETAVGSGITPPTLEEIVISFFNANAFLGRTVVVLKDADTYVLQSDQIDGRTDTDILIKLTGVTAFSATELFAV